MLWKCGCGVVNSDPKTNCRACGTPKGMVWTPEGFKPPEEAAALEGPVSEKQGYGWGWATVVVASISFISALSEAPGDPSGSIAAALVVALVGCAAATRQPWGWYVMVISCGLALSFLVVVGAGAIARGEPSAKAVVLLVVYGPVQFLWFVYFYKRRVMFGAGGRWRWFERTFPKLVGPEEEAPRVEVEPRGEEVGVPHDKPLEKQVRTPVKKGPPYLNKQCPRCVEEIRLEDIKCLYCHEVLDPEEVASSIDLVLKLHQAELDRLIDFKSATKQCPACAETIKLEALICRYCRREITSAEMQISKMKALREKVETM